jgi:hypothetical protein
LLPFDIVETILVPEKQFVPNKPPWLILELAQAWKRLYFRRFSKKWKNNIARTQKSPLRKEGAFQFV